jgi:hypothetical protein
LLLPRWKEKQSHQDDWRERIKDKLFKASDSVLTWRQR